MENFPKFSYSYSGGIHLNGVDSLQQNLDKAESEDSSDSESIFDSNSSDDEEFIYKDGFYAVNDSKGKETSPTRNKPVDYKALYEETRQKTGWYGNYQYPISNNQYPRKV